MLRHIVAELTCVKTVECFCRYSWHSVTSLCVAHSVQGSCYDTVLACQSVQIATLYACVVQVATTLEPIEEEVQSAAVTNRAKGAKKTTAAKTTATKGKQQQTPAWH